MTETDPELASQLSEAHNDVAAQLTLDLEAVLRLPQGRRVLFEILGRCGVYRNPYTGDNNATNQRLGELNVGLWLISMIGEVGPTEYPMLLLDAARQKDLAKKETARVLDPDE